MPRFSTIVAIAILAAAPLAAGGEGPSSSAAADERAVRQIEDRWIDALAHHDAAALGAILDERFLEITYTGRVRDRKEALAMLSAPGQPEMDQRLEDLNVRFPAAGVAVVTGINAVTGRNPVFSARVRFTDVFVRTGDKWRAFSAQETLEK